MFSLTAALKKGAPRAFPARITRTYLTRSGPPKSVSAEDAISHIPSSSRIYAHGVASFPATLMKALAARHADETLYNIEVNHLHSELPNPCSSPSITNSPFFVNNFFIGAHERKNVAEGRSDYIPAFLSDIPKLMRTRVLPPDWALVNVSPPDKHGYCSLGIEVATAYPAVEVAPNIIAQINPNVPRTHGTSNIHMNCFKYIVHADDPLPEHLPGTPNDVEAAIGKHIAGLVDDGATLQMGIGSIPNAVLSNLSNHKNLGIHTEMFSEGVINLIERGVVNNSKKKYLPGRIVTAFIMGSRKLYDFVDDNTEIAFLDASVTNNPRIIATNPKVTAINSAVEVDLTGQVCADSVGTRMISGVGGQVDFERGAALSERGVPIICLPSTSEIKDKKTGQVKKISRIVPTLQLGAGVITTRYHVHYVVTEYGIAHLFGRNLRQRARQLIDIAHPDHREFLHKQAYERLKCII